jgi:hypothetical protein
MPGTKNTRDLQLVDAVLTNLARAYKPQGMIYDQVFPTIPVELDSGRYPIFDGFFDDDVDNKVSDRALTPEVDFAWSTDTYYCEDYRLKATITRKEERNAHSVVRLRQTKLEIVLMRMALRRERRAAAVLKKISAGTPGQLTSGAAPSTNWDQATATIETDIKTGAMAVRDLTGMVTNTMVIPFKVAYEMAMQEDIRALLRWDVTGTEHKVLELGDRLLPGVIHGHRVIIPGGMYNTAKEGATRSLSDIWGDDVRLLYYPAGGGGWGMPAVAYSFKALPEVVDRWNDNDPPVESVRAWECLDEKVCAPDMGYEIQDVLS